MADKKTRRGGRGKGGKGKTIKERVINEEEGVVVKVLEFGNRGDPGKSKQLTPDLFEQVVADGEVVRPLYDPLLWAMLLEQNVRLDRCVTVMALNTVGLGFELAPLHESKEFIEINAAEIKAERERLLPLLKYPNAGYSFEEMMQMIKTDEEAEGQGYMEVTRGGGGEIDGLYHAPGHTIRVLTKKTGFLQMRSNIGTDAFVFSPGKTSKESTEKVYFKNFGDKRVMDNETGEFTTKALSPEQRANEILQFKIYTPRSSYYGVPRYVAAAPAITGNRLAQLRNVSFFENDATPRLAIIVSGGNLDSTSIQMIEDFIEAKGKGPMNFGRVMLLQAEMHEAIPEAVSKVNIQLIPLTVGVTEDASFTRYLMLNDETIREAFGIGKIFLGTADDVNRATAITLKQVTMEQVFEPETRRYEHRFNMTVMRDLGAKYTRFRFIRPEAQDLNQSAAAYSVLAAAGGVTPNDIRRLLGFDLFQADWAATPLPLLKEGYSEGDVAPPQNVDVTGEGGQEEGKKGHISGAEMARIRKIYGEATGYTGSFNLIAAGEPIEVLKALRGTLFE